MTGWLTSSYGKRTDPFTREADFHPGLDISADYGQPVLATGDATVDSAGANGAYGNMVTLDHGFGIVTKYGHLSRIAVFGAQRVKRGDIIGYVGSTGLSSGPHVHFEVLVNKEFVDPMSIQVPRERKLDGKSLTEFQKERARIDDLMRRAPVMTASK